MTESHSQADDESLSLDSATAKKLGTIEIEVTRVNYLGASDSPVYRDVKGVGPVHEKSKKVGGHCVSCVIDSVFCFTQLTNTMSSATEILLPHPPLG